MMRRAFGAVLFLGLTGCAVTPPPCPDHDGYTRVSALACHAGRGDKRAAFELGRRYELGAGVPTDPARAVQLYRQAAAYTSGSTPVYLPPVGNAKYGTVMQVRTGPDVPGLPEAQLGLARLQLEGRGVRRDPKAACRSARRAAEAGLPEARAWLAEVGCP